MLVAAFFAVEGRIWQGKAARSLSPGKADRGATRGVGAAFGTALTAGPAASLLPRRRLPGPPGGLAPPS